MPRFLHLTTAWAVVTLLFTGPGRLLASGAGPSLLVFTRTEGFDHPSIVDGVTMFVELAAAHGFTVSVTDETGEFTDTGLGAYDVVVWLSTTGDVLDPPEEAAFRAFIEQGGGYLGIHAAADCEYGWPWYGEEILGNGAWFDSHPAIQEARLLLEGDGSPAPGSWEGDTLFTDEWYNFRANPRDVVQVVQTLDESSYSGGNMGPDHPIAWARTVLLGRVFYTGLGHRSETFADPRFRAQIVDAVGWLSGAGSSIFSDGFESGDTSAWGATTP